MPFKENICRKYEKEFKNKHWASRFQRQKTKFFYEHTDIDSA